MTDLIRLQSRLRKILCYLIALSLRLGQVTILLFGENVSIKFALCKERKRRKTEANGKIEIQKQRTNKQIKADHTYS